MEAIHGLAAILRDAAKTPLLRMRSEIVGWAKALLAVPTNSS
jgi:hypothetical protein